MNVARKNIGSEGGWGNLPPKDREQAMQQIGRDFPSHYRDVIEQYFRRLAAEGSQERNEHHPSRPAVDLCAAFFRGADARRPRRDRPAARADGGPA